MYLCTTVWIASIISSINSYTSKENTRGSISKSNDNDLRCIVHKIYCHFILSRQFHEVCVQNGFISQYFHNTRLCQAVIVELLPKKPTFFE